MKTDLWKSTWPLPAWAVLPPAVGIGLITAWFTADARSWQYLSLPLLSSLPRDAVAVAGVLAAATAAVDCHAFCRRQLVPANFAAQNATRVLPLRVMTVLSAWFVGAHLVGALIPIALLARRAQAGSVQWLLLLPSSASIAFFVAFGVLVWAVIERWWAPLVTLPMTLVVGIGAVAWASESVVLAQSEPVAWMLPAAPVTSFEGVRTAPALLLAGWLCILVATVFAVVVAIRLLRSRSGSVWAFVPVAVGLALLLATSIAAVTSGMKVHDQWSGGPVQCDQRDDLSVCLTAEESPVLTPAAKAVSQIMHRLGSRPDGLTTVGSERALTALRKPLNAPDVLKLGVGPMSGAKHTGDTVADILSGTAACQPGKTAPRALDWSLSLAYWLARPEEQQDLARAMLQGDPSVARTQPDVVLATAELSRVQAWYRANAQSLRSCTYVGSGP